MLFFFPVFLLAAILPGKKKKFLIWGTVPLVGYKYWSEAMREAGYPSKTLMQGHFRINDKKDFDLYFEDFAPSFLPKSVRINLGSCFALIYVLRNASVVHLSLFGFLLNSNISYKLERILFQLAGIRVVVIAFGSDAYLYSQVIDPSLRHGLLSSYPELARIEDKTGRRVRHWVKHADIVLASCMLDGIGRWDVTMNQCSIIDIKKWAAKNIYSPADGRHSAVRIIHTPNHRGFKGTEFLVEAIKELKEEGLLIDLILLEGKSNEQVRQHMSEADILAEQFIFTGYAQSGIEGMASGLAVLSNLEHEAYTRVFRRFSFLNECPILSTSPETLKNNLRTLIQNPELRQSLGSAGRQYVEKYHSYRTAQFLFSSIYDKIIHNKEVDLMNLFHPLKSSFNRSVPLVDHPLVENSLVQNYMVE